MERQWLCVCSTGERDVGEWGWRGSCCATIGACGDAALLLFPRNASGARGLSAVWLWSCRCHCATRVGGLCCRCGCRCARGACRVGGLCCRCSVGNDAAITAPAVLAQGGASARGAAFPHTSSGISYGWDAFPNVTSSGMLPHILRGDAFPNDTSHIGRRTRCGRGALCCRV